MEEAIILGSHMPTIGPLLEKRRHLAGDIVEFGVYNGDTTVQLAQYGRTVWAFDTFEGIPESKFLSGIDVDLPGKFVPPPSVFQKLSHHPNIHPVVGLIEGTLKMRYFDDMEVVLAYVDCDLQQTTSYALDWLAKHLVPRGVIVVDDYATHPGIRLAVHAFLNSHAICAEFDHFNTIYWQGRV